LVKSDSGNGQLILNPPGADGCERIHTGRRRRNAKVCFLLIDFMPSACLGAGQGSTVFYTNAAPNEAD
jgi:hypothetical protein